MLSGVGINEIAVKHANSSGFTDVICDDITKPLKLSQVDLVLCMGVLIHIQPEYLSLVYENLVGGFKRYILVGEYYNPAPVEVEYRGIKGVLYIQDFAGEMIDRFNLKLIGYGFVYHRDV